MAADLDSALFIIDPVSGEILGISAGGARAYFSAPNEAYSYVTLTGSATAFAGPCEIVGWYCSVAAGNITIYDALSATGTPIVPATALVAGPMPILGPSTVDRIRFDTGCHVVLSGAATVRIVGLLRSA